jgi:hypothetical protein
MRCDHARSYIHPGKSKQVFDFSWIGSSRYFDESFKPASSSFDPAHGYLARFVPIGSGFSFLVSVALHEAPETGNGEAVLSFGFLGFA